MGIIEMAATTELFPPDQWIELPSGDGLAKSDLGPCPTCGSATFDVRRYQPAGEGKGRMWIIGCPKCIPFRGEPRKRPGEVLWGVVDAERGYRAINPELRDQR